jgi:hypothetical protein
MTDVTVALRSGDRCQACAVTDAAPAALPDGSYEAIVVDAEGDSDPEVMVLSIAVVSGPAKGQLVEVRAVKLQYDVLDLLAMPCVLTVADGEPKVVFD